MSYVELYNNTFRNLLSGAGSKSSHAAPAATPTAESGVRGADTPPMRSTKIEVRESKGAGIFLKGPGVHVSVTSEEEAAALIVLGQRARAAGATNCNEHSSRSHAVLTFHIESRTMCTEATETGEVRMGKLHLIDLAGRRVLCDAPFAFISLA
jgi:hypothetical protein